MNIEDVKSGMIVKVNGFNLRFKIADSKMLVDEYQYDMYGKDMIPCIAVDDPKQKIFFFDVSRINKFDKSKEDTVFYTVDIDNYFSEE